MVQLQRERYRSTQSLVSAQFPQRRLYRTNCCHSTLACSKRQMCLRGLAALTETDELVERQREDRPTKRDVKM